MSNPSYSAAMSGGEAYITVTLDLEEPVEIVDFARFFAAFGDQFDSYIANNYPDISGDAKIYVKEVRSGSVVADIVPHIKDAIAIMDSVLIVSGFAGLIGYAIRQYIKGDRLEDASKGDLGDIADIVKSVAHDKDGEARIESVRYQQGVWNRELEIQFNTQEARKAVEALEHHKADLDKTESADHKRVLLTFERSSKVDAQLGKRSGERVVIEGIDPKARALIYSSDLAEEQIKHEIREADDNVYKKGFVVDVNVETKGGRVVAYRVTGLHQVIDLPDDD